MSDANELAIRALRRAIGRLTNTNSSGTIAQCQEAITALQEQYLAPVQPLSIDKIMEVYHEHEQWFNLHGGTPAKRSGNFKARLNKLIG